jgi:hypothetical protein
MCVRVSWCAKVSRRPHGRDKILFYEYFHGDNGAGYGASHQTGWTGLLSKKRSLRNRRIEYFRERLVSVL